MLFIWRVSFRYEPESPEVLSGLNLEIRRGERIGLVETPAVGRAPRWIC